MSAAARQHGSTAARQHGSIARTMFAARMAYALAHGVPRVLWPFLVVEAALAVVELGPWLLHHNTWSLDRRSGTGSRRSRAGRIAV
ncbi:hypothetical protein ACFYNY_21255 [Streptomyces sp. NPDC006530]|uniref:hypothetical protein n=1 Tax=Streptomyces sp. NPDC006530 TaxID=3364750 RepID=UPI0036877FEF